MNEIDNTQNTEPALVGKLLKAGREAAGLTPENIAEKLKLSTRQIVALENDDYSALPGNVFVRGFVRNYARMVNIDPQPLLDNLSTILPQERVQIAMPRVGDATALNVTVKTSADGQPILVWMMIGLGLLLGAGAVFWYLQQPPTPEVAVVDASAPIELPPPVSPGLAATERTSEPDSIPVILDVASASAPGASKVATIAVASAIKVAASVPVVLRASMVASKPVAASSVASRPVAQVASLSATANMIRVVAEFDSWVQVTDADGQALISQLMGPGAERVASGRPPFRIKIGNAPKTRLYYRGQAVDLAPYAKADVATLELK